MNRIDGIILDMDGTIYLGDQALPGAVETIKLFRQRGKKLAFVSNKPLESRQAYAEKLTRLGIPATAEQVITSARVLGNYLANYAPQLCYYVVGEANLRDELRSFGLIISEELLEQDPQEVIDPQGIDAVVVSFDRTLDYRKLNTAYQALNRGARYFATNPDKACPMPGGAIPDAGATLSYLKYITGRDPELVAGKPSSLMLKTASEILQVPRERCLVIGDRLETDVRMGIDGGMATALVLTGVTRRSDLDSTDVRPDFILDSLPELLKLVS